MPDLLPTPSALIDAAAMAVLLSVSKPTIWRMRESGRLPPAIAFTAQCIRWRRDDVLRWIAAGCPAANEQRPAGANGEASIVKHTPMASEVTR